MPNKLNPKTIALSAGTTVAVLHTAGTLFILLGGISFWQWAHFLSWNATTLPFAFGPFLTGIVISFCIGALVGWLFSVIYNKTI